MRKYFLKNRLVSHGRFNRFREPKRASIPFQYVGICYVLQYSRVISPKMSGAALKVGVELPSTTAPKTASTFFEPATENPPPPHTLSSTAAQEAKGSAFFFSYATKRASAQCQLRVARVLDFAPNVGAGATVQCLQGAMPYTIHTGAPGDIVVYMYIFS